MKRKKEKAGLRNIGISIIEFKNLNGFLYWELHITKQTICRYIYKGSFFFYYNFFLDSHMHVDFKQEL